MGRIPEPRSGPRSDGLDTGVSVLDRCVAILDAVENGARTHADIVRSTGLSRTTAHRMLKALDAHGLVTYQGGHGYRLGPRLLRLASASLHEIALRDAAHAALERLAHVTGESAQLFVPSVGARVCVDSVQSSSELRTFVRIGAELPITAGSAGKVMMAWMPAPERKEVIGRAERLTPDTPVGDDLVRQLGYARRQGWAASSGERQPGVGSVSAPVLAENGQLVAVVSISGPTNRLGRISARRYAPAVVAAAMDVERSLGFSRPAS
jgi:DNA-binding IclR family transcriptional regulator